MSNNNLDLEMGPISDLKDYISTISWMGIFNHSSQSITLRYIGINQDMHDEIYSKVQF